MIGPLLQRLSHYEIPPGVIRAIANRWPPFRACGIRVERVRPDFLEIDVTMRPTWRNVNFRGTLAGGPLYEMADPFLVYMVAKQLGRGYVVWDSEVAIRFLRPGASKVTAKFALSAETIAQLKATAEKDGRASFQQTISILDSEQRVVAEVDKTLVVKRSAKAARPSKVPRPSKAPSP